MSLHAPSSPALLQEEADSVRALVVHGVDAATPFRLDVRDAGEASVTDSTFRSVEGSINIVIRKLTGNFNRPNLKSDFGQFFRSLTIFRQKQLFADVFFKQISHKVTKIF